MLMTGDQKNRSPNFRSPQLIKVIAELIHTKTFREIADELGANNHSTISAVYREKILPELRKYNWRAEVARATVPAMAAAKLWRYIEADTKGELGLTVVGRLRQEFNINSNAYGAARAVMRYGCPSLIARCNDGTILLVVAKKIARDNPNDNQKQLDALRKYTPGRNGGGENRVVSEKRKEEALDELRSRVSQMVDQQLAWQQRRGDKAIVDIRESAAGTSAEDLAEIIKCLRMVSQWTATIANKLEK